MTVLSFNEKFHRIGLGLTVFTAIGLSTFEPVQALSFPPAGNPPFNSAQQQELLKRQQEQEQIRQPQEAIVNDSENTATNLNLTSELPESVATALLQNVSQQSGVPVSDLQILGTEQVTWRDGCMGLNSPDMACTLALVEGWRVVVQSNDQTWVYHTNGSRFLLASGEIPTPIPQPAGTSQENPILPDITEPNMWGFRQVPRGLWFDPPTAYGFQYKMTSNSLFTEILDFPTGFKKPFAVLVKDILLGEFTAGNRLNFTDYSALLGNLLVGGSGVKEFTVAGLNVDPTNPAAFPIKLDFNTDVAGFNMYALTHNAPAEEVPEPLSILGTLTFSTFLAAKVYQRKQKRSV